MGLDAEILVNNYSLDSKFAEKLLNFTNGDIEGAIRILEASEKDVIAIKGKFLSTKKLSFGAMILFYNFQTQLPEYILCALTSNTNISKLPMDIGWQEYVDSLIEFMRMDGADFEFASRIENEILASNNIEYVKSFFTSKANMDLVNLKRYMMSALGRVMADNSIILKLSAVNIDVFKFKHIISVLKTGLKIVPKQGRDRIILLKFSVEPVLAPIGGKDIDSLIVGTEILVKITDERAIVKYIGRQIGFLDETDVIRPAYGCIVQNDKSPETDNNLVLLEFGPGIYASLVVGSKIRVQVNDGKKQDDNSINAKLKNDANTMDTLKTISNFENVDFSQQGFSSDIPSEFDTNLGLEKPKKNIFLIVNIIVLVLVAIIVAILVLFG